MLLYKASHLLCVLFTKFGKVVTYVIISSPITTAGGGGMIQQLNAMFKQLMDTNQQL